MSLVLRALAVLRAGLRLAGGHRAAAGVGFVVALGWLLASAGRVSAAVPVHYRDGVPDGHGYGHGDGNGYLAAFLDAYGFPVAVVVFVGGAVALVLLGALALCYAGERIARLWLFRGDPLRLQPGQRYRDLAAARLGRARAHGLDPHSVGVGS